MLTPRVLVTDGDQRSALACVRALGRAGHECHVIGPDQGSLAAASRFCRSFAPAPDPQLDPEGFREVIRTQLDSWGIEVLLPMTEKALRVALPMRGELGSVLLPFPESEVFGAVSDKARVLRVAGDLGLAVPEQWELGSPDAAGLLDIPADMFPLAVKPTVSVRTGAPGGAEPAVRYHPDEESLRAWIREANPGHFPVLIQQRIMGTGAGVFLLLWDGRLVASVGHRRVREKPPSGGVSVVRESTVVDPGLLGDSLALLSALGFHTGVAMVEFKIQERTQIPYLMEINGRFWGSLQLAIDAGVDFPSLLVACATEGPPHSPVVGRPGVRTRWLLGDLDQLLVRLARSRRSLALPDSFPGRLRGLLDFLLDFRPGVRTEVLKLGDPRPFLAELRAWVRHL